MASKWAPLEANPEVLGQWAGLAGLPLKKYAFSDVYGLDDELLGMVPQPVRAVLLVYSIQKDIENLHKDKDASTKAEELDALDPKPFFIKQTISNACGTMALLHAIYNSSVDIEEGSGLEKFRIDGVGKSPEELAALLEKTSYFAEAHKEAAAGGQSNMPANLNTEEHFVAFVQLPEAGSSKKRLVLFDGRRPAPFIYKDESEDLLKHVAKVVKEEYMATIKGDNFTMITLGPAWD